jgi:hypothetical protein
MRSILDKRLNANKKSQVIIINLMFLFMAIAVMMAMVPAFRSMLDMARGSDSLNCKSTLRVCSASMGEPCYNSSISSETLACTFIDLYLPYLIMVVLIAGITKLMANRVMDQFATPQQNTSMYG